MDEFYCIKTAAALLIRLHCFWNWYRFLPYMGSSCVALKFVTTKGTFLCHSLSYTYNESHLPCFHLPFWLSYVLVYFFYLCLNFYPS